MGVIFSSQTILEGPLL